MSKCLLLLLSIGLPATLAPVPARAENVEITPFAGYTTGGGFTETVSGTSLSLEEAANYGIMIDVRQFEESWIELYYSRQQTRLRPDSEPPSSSLGFDVDIDYYHVGGTYGVARGSVFPFVVGTLGATHLNPRGADLSSETKFSLSLGGGAKLALTKRLGLRLDGRWFGTVVGASGSVFCSSGTCLIKAEGDVVSQFTANAGATITF